MTDINIVQIFILIIALVISIVGHEYAHGKAAYYYGDDTAKKLGRLSLNPIRHIDIFGTILVPIILFFTTDFIFGWAKPVPINTIKVLENGGVKGAVIVSLSGIFYNLIFALISLFILKNFYTAINSEHVRIFLVYLIFLNFLLGLFNLYPFPPLDGSRALAYILAWFGLLKVANLLLNRDKEWMIVLIILLISPLNKYFLYPLYYLVGLFA